MAKNKTAKATETTPEPTTESGVKVTLLCKKYGVDPKRARARLRRLVKNTETANQVPAQLVAGSWVFAEKDRARAEKLIASFAKGGDDEGDDE